MEPNTSAKSMDTDCEDKLDDYEDKFDDNEDKLDKNNLIDDYFGLDLKKEGPVNNPTIVFFALDTTDNKQHTKLHEICQIAAACRGNNGEINKFQVYMKPEKYGIAPSISVKKGYKMGTDGRLLLGENEVDASTQREGLEKFLNFLSDQTDGTRSLLLAAHKCNEIRRPLLLRHMEEYCLLPVCKTLVSGFIDTDIVIKSIIMTIHRQEHGNDESVAAIPKTKFELINLAKDYLDLDILPERADVSVQVLMSLINCFAMICTDAMLADNVTLFNYDVYELLMDLMRYFPPAQVDFVILVTLVPIPVQPAHVQNQVSVKMLNKIAVARISTTMLLSEYTRHGDVSNLLRPVTKKRAVIECINARLAAMTNGN